MQAKRIISPCNNICKFDYAKDICIGCGRTSREITNWIFYSDEERENILDQLMERLANYKNADSTKTSR